jgi:Polysaccharide deacetylase
MITKVKSVPGDGKCGCLVISFDVELAWGAIESGRWLPRQANGVYERTRAVTRQLLEAFDSYEIPATFAIVGGMLEAPGKWVLDHLPEQARDRTWRALRDGQPSSFHGRDMIELITRTRIRHPIASHSYSHTRFLHPGVTHEFVREDLRNYWRVLPAELNAIPALVFPQNDEGYYPEVRESGFRAVRGRDPEPSGRYRWERQLKSVICTPPLSEIADVGNGLVRNTGSLRFISGHRRRLLLVERLGRLGLDRAVCEGGTLHTWNHPYNFAETPGLLSAFSRFLRKAAMLRDQGRLVIGQMETGT